jgi:hypothetical protein
MAGTCISALGVVTQSFYFLKAEIYTYDLKIGISPDTFQNSQILKGVNLSNFVPRDLSSSGGRRSDFSWCGRGFNNGPHVDIDS